MKKKCEAGQRHKVSMMGFKHQDVPKRGKEPPHSVFVTFRVATDRSTVLNCGTVAELRMHPCRLCIMPSHSEEILQFQATLDIKILQ
jgi:hypothetical protein